MNIPVTIQFQNKYRDHRSVSVRVSPPSVEEVHGFAVLEFTVVYRPTPPRTWPTLTLELLPYREEAEYLGNLRRYRGAI